MTDWTLTGNESRLSPYAVVLGRFEGLDFAASTSPAHWKELAIVLAEETDFHPGVAAKVVNDFLLAERLDDRGRPRTDVPSAPELRAFARRRAVADPPDGKIPEPCPNCVGLDGRWRLTVKGGIEVPVPCLCKRGKYLARRRDADRRRTA